MTQAMIEYRGFSRAYGSVVAVDSLDLAIRPGETVALIGPNGSGKTTSLKAALGLVRPSAGSVTVAGRDAIRDGRTVRQLLGYLPQRLTFPEGLTARGAMELYARLRGSTTDIDVLLRRVGLADAAHRTAETFSGGMRQRLGIAIALLGEPAALILDEPTAALDPGGALMVRDLLREIRDDGTTVLLSSHDLAEVATLADRVAIFVAGKLAASGRIKDLVQQYGTPLPQGCSNAAADRAVADGSVTDGAFAVASAGSLAFGAGKDAAQFGLEAVYRAALRNNWS